HALSRFTLDVSPPAHYVFRYQKDAFLCRQNDSDRALYVLLDGAVGVLVRGKYIAHITLPGEAFGELSLFLRGKRTADLVAEQPTAILRLTPENLPEFHETHPQMFLIIARTLAQRLESNLERLKYLVSVQKTIQSDSMKDREILANFASASKELSLLQQQILSLKRFSNIPELNTFINREDLEPLEFSGS
ncbi:MAG: cyclic nucleotide-binding domain-containing protein, partial [Bdellovibrionales bacterium]|nr:cyclic nucleotide-binding domain-containing protein [Bdellovibrionales bacterium]